MHWLIVCHNWSRLIVYPFPIILQHYFAFIKWFLPSSFNGLNDRDTTQYRIDLFVTLDLDLLFTLLELFYIFFLHLFIFWAIIHPPSWHIAKTPSYLPLCLRRLRDHCISLSSLALSSVSHLESQWRNSAMMSKSFYFPSWLARIVISNGREKFVILLSLHDFRTILSQTKKIPSR